MYKPTSKTTIAEHTNHIGTASQQAIYAHRPSDYGENKTLTKWAESPSALYFFATAPRGLEEILAKEIETIAKQVCEEAKDINITDGGVSVVGSLQLAWAINLYSRISNRVLWKIADGRYRDDHDIYTLSRQIAWSAYFREDRTFRVDTVAIFSPLRSIAITSLRAKDGLCDHFRDIYGIRPSVDKANPNVRVRLFIEKQNITFYLDLSGESLFKRGYRGKQIHESAAPIKENLAAGLLMLMNWHEAQTLYDPFCGSGTFLIEAARMVLNIPSGGNRHFAFENLLSFDNKTWKAMRDKAINAAFTVANYTEKTGKNLPVIIGADADSMILSKVRQQMSDWGWSQWIKLRHGRFEDLSAPKNKSQATALLIANPPYGERMGEATNLSMDYKIWGSTLKHSYAGWTSGWITGDVNMVRGLGLKPKKKMAMFNGDIPAQFLIIPLFAGKRHEHLSQVSENTNPHIAHS